jgi:hypothetical protein
MNLSDIRDMGVQEVDILALRESAWNDRIGVYLRYYSRFNDKVVVPKDLEFEEIERDSYNYQPLFELLTFPIGNEAQKLMDSLWDCGLRPSQGKGSAGAMDATQKHLEDMRKIVANKLKVEL